MYDALQDDYRLTAAEVDRAVVAYLAARGGGVTDTPGGAASAAADAYAGWAAAADPAVVALREADQRVNGIRLDLAAPAGHAVEQAEKTHKRRDTARSTPTGEHQA